MIMTTDRAQPIGSSDNLVAPIVAAVVVSFSIAVLLALVIAAMYFIRRCKQSSIRKEDEPPLNDPEQIVFRRNSYETSREENYVNNAAPATQTPAPLILPPPNYRLSYIEPDSNVPDLLQNSAFLNNEIQESSNV